MQLAERWGSLEELVAAHPTLRLDLGCGWVKQEGCVGLDDLRGVGGLMGQSEADGRGPDVFLDLNADPYPFADGSVAEVRSRHFLEHSHLDHVFEQSARLLRPGGLFVAVVPYANSADGLAPGHNIFLTERFFDRNPTFQRLFATRSVSFRQSEEWEAWPRVLRRAIPYRWARTHLFNVCKEMRIEAVRR